MGCLASRSNGEGLQDLAVDPTTRGRNHARKVRGDSGLGLSPSGLDGTLAFLDIPAWNAHENKQYRAKMAVRLPHDCIRSMWEENADKLRTTSYQEEDYMVPAVMEHPVVQLHGVEHVVGLRLYSDKVKLNRYDTF